MSEKQVTTIASALTIMGILAGAAMWATSTYAKVEAVPVLKKKVDKLEDELHSVHINVCVLLHNAGLKASGCGE